MLQDITAHGENRHCALVTQAEPIPCDHSRERGARSSGPGERNVAVALVRFGVGGAIALADCDRAASAGC